MNNKIEEFINNAKKACIHVLKECDGHVISTLLWNEVTYKITNTMNTINHVVFDDSFCFKVICNEETNSPEIIQDNDLKLKFFCKFKYDNSSMKYFVFKAKDNVDFRI